ncbi:aldo/keto reductase [Synechococcus sp. W4D4]|uniref:aldo/keto reductase n=1 Tax=Synechococcus sp. W4D4 TaxID=3392294 RepID=UPI0039EAF883
MFKPISMPDGRQTSSLGFGCASLMNIPSSSERTYILDLAYDHGITHFDTARMYGLGHAEQELRPLLATKRSKITLATKFGLDNPLLFKKFSNRQSLLRSLIRRNKLTTRLAKKLYSHIAVSRTFSSEACQESLLHSLKSLNTDLVDILYMHDPLPSDQFDPSLPILFDSFKANGLIRYIGIAANPSSASYYINKYPSLFDAIQLGTSSPSLALTPHVTGVHSFFGHIRHLAPILQSSFSTAPALCRLWSDRLSIDLTLKPNLAAVVLAAKQLVNPSSIHLFSTTKPGNLAHIMTCIQNSSWSDAELISFARFLSTLSSKYAII